MRSGCRRASIVANPEAPAFVEPLARAVSGTYRVTSVASLGALKSPSLRCATQVLPRSACALCLLCSGGHNNKANQEFELVQQEELKSNLLHLRAGDTIERYREVAPRVF
jgi:hypothetical protein